MAHFFGNGKNSGSNTESKRNEARCTKCNTNKHTKETYWKINGYPEWHPRFKKKGRRFSQAHNASGSKFSQLQNSDDDSGYSTANVQQPDLETMVHEMYAMFKGKQMSETPLTAGRGKQIDFTGFAAYSCISNSIKDNEWVIDSGATSHMSSNIDFFAKVEEEKSLHIVILPDGTKQLVTHIGYVHLSKEVQLQNVLYIPLFKYNLISVGQLLEESKVSIIFQPNFCYLQDLAN